jgi:hypothetical protein
VEKDRELAALKPSTCDHERPFCHDTPGCSRVEGEDVCRDVSHTWADGFCRKDGKRTQPIPSLVGDEELREVLAAFKSMFHLQKWDKVWHERVLLIEAAYRAKCAEVEEVRTEHADCALYERGAIVQIKVLEDALTEAIKVALDKPSDHLAFVARIRAIQGKGMGE